MAKRALITKLYAEDATAADVTFTHKDGATTVVVRLTGIPLDDKDLAKEWLATYEDALQAARDAAAPRVRGPKAVALNDDLNLVRAGG